MKETVYKSLSLSLLITNIWTIIAFFTYFYDTGLFKGWNTLIFYAWSCWITAALGIIIILMSLLKNRFSTSLKIFSLTTSTFLNAFYTIIFIILSVQQLIRVEALIEMFLAANLIISIASLLIINKIRNHTIVVNT